jgi:hypothetical protein
MHDLQRGKTTWRSGIPVSGPLSARWFHVLLGTLGWLFGMPGRLGLVSLVPGRPFAITRPFGTWRFHVFPAPFGGLLGMLWPLLAHRGLPRYASRSPFVPARALAEPARASRGRKRRPDVPRQCYARFAQRVCT